MTTMISAAATPHGPRRPLAVLDHLIAQVAAAEARWLANAAEAADGAGRFAALARLSDERLVRLRASRQGLLANGGRQHGAGSVGGVTPVADNLPA